MGRRVRRPPAWTQLGLQAAPGTRGGLRRNAGRKTGRRTTVERAARPRLTGRDPCHVTLKLRSGLPSLRRHRIYRVLAAAFRAGKDKFGFRLVHYSVQSNHLHLICEAESTRSLSRGMQGLAIRIARRLNREMERKGKLFHDRYHLHVLEHPREVRRSLLYVLRNAVNHDASPPGPFIDVYSSAPFFDGWREKIPPVLLEHEPPVVPPTVWLLTTGWKKGGLISFAEEPARRR